MLVDEFDLNQKAIIKRVSITNDGQGGFTKTTTTIEGSLTCAIWVESASVNMASDRMTYVEQIKAACRPSTKYRVNDKFINQGSTFDIKSLDNTQYQGEILFITGYRTDNND